MLTCIKNYNSEDINILMYKYLEKSYEVLSSEGILFIADWTKNMSSYDEDYCKKNINNMIVFEKNNESFDNEEFTDELYKEKLKVNGKES